MKKKDMVAEYTASLEERFDRWDEVYKNGCRDPFWSDGVNLNLIRNHIQYYKSELENCITDEAYPDAYYRDTPPKVDSEYIARKEEIKENAINTLSVLQNDATLKMIKRKMLGIDEKFLVKNSVKAVVNYETALQNAIDENDYVVMRRYEQPDYFLDSINRCAEKMSEYVPPENQQMSLFDLEETEFRISM